jgi:uncharacterized membrane protein (DUF485 family)
MKPTSSEKPAAAPHVDDHAETSAANARSGLILFFVYLVFYAGFMAMAAFAPAAMGRPAVAGVNLAIVYGMGLIAGALVVAAIYMRLCGRNARQFHAAGSQQAEGGR